MIGTVKGCVNEKCVANRKKTHYKKADEYCTKCGEKLQYVCADCFTVLPNNKMKYCDLCMAKRSDKKDKAIKSAEKVGTGILAVAGLAVSIGKAGIDIIKK